MMLKELLEGGSPSNLSSLISVVERADAADIPLDTTGHVHFLRNFTIELIEPFLKYRIYEAGIRPQVSFGGYDTIYQELLDTHPEQDTLSPDITVLSLMLDRLDPQHHHPGWNSDKTAENLCKLFDLAAEKTNSLIVVNTFIPPFYREQGIALLENATDSEYEIRRLNDRVRNYVAGNASRFFLVDWGRLLRILGEERSIDYRYWYTSHAPFKSEFLDLYATEISRLIQASKGNIKKCLILDCDNTLWGGVIGEDGIEGIQIDPNEWPGKAFYRFQTSLLHLIERGVLIALCSKNNERDVWDVLDNHPDCLLKREHIAAWKIDWNNKASGISALAEELNLGLDSFVFIDDDPAQCELIKQSLPEVEVIQVPEHLYNYPDLLSKTRLFDTLAISEEDRNRTALYLQQEERSQERGSFSNIDDYLKSLEMHASIHRAHSRELPRVAQLTQKTNQFNLTTCRYSNPEIAALHEDPDSAIFTLKVSDRFGDLGLTGVLIAKLSGQTVEVDTLLLSCRILGRELEYLFVDYCLTELESQWKVTTWRARFIPTRKNRQTSGFWDKLGFNLLSETDGRKHYAIPSDARQRYNKVLTELQQDQE